MLEQTNQEVLAMLGKRFDELRRKKIIRDEEVIARSGVSHGTLSAFKSGKGNISMINFIKLLRAIDAIEHLEGLLLSEGEAYSPLPQKESRKLPQRIHKKNKPNTFKWGDES